MIFYPDQKRARIAAMMAVSNMGQLGFNVTIKQVLNWTPNTRFPGSAEDEVIQLAGHLIEDEEQEGIFAYEAEGWDKEIKKIGFEQFMARFPHHADTIRKILEINNS